MCSGRFAELGDHLAVTANPTVPAGRAGPSGAEQARLTLESRISVIIERGGAGGGEGKILNRLHNKQMTISLPLILPCLGWIHFCIIVF